MKSLIEYISEKLKINKDSKLGINNINSIQEFVNCIENNYDIISGTKGQISKIDYRFEYGLLSYLFKNYVDNGGKNGIADYSRWLDEMEKKKILTSESGKAIHLYGLSKESICFYIIPNEFLCIFFADFKVAELNKIEDVFNRSNYDWEQVKIKEICNNKPFYIYADKNLTYSEGLEILTNILNDITIKFDIKQFNNNIKSGEVLPGWTLDDIKKRYDKIFDDIKIMRSGNIKLGHLREKNDWSYDHSTFRIDTDIQYRNGIMIGRRKDNSSSSGNNFVLEPTVDKAFDELDRKLRKKGYTI